MIVTLDDFNIGQGTRYDIEQIDGLGPSAIRTSQFNFSGRSGGLVTDQFYGLRIMTVTGKVRSLTCDDHVSDRLAFENATPIDTTIPVTITLFNGDQYVIYCKVYGFDMEYLPGGRFSDYKLDLIAGDPLFYSLDGGEVQSAVVPRSTEGGYVTPYDLPVDWESGSSPTIVVNGGNGVAYPVITLTDSAGDPTITNQTTGETFGLDIDLIDGDEVVIDMANRTVTLNGDSIFGNITSDSVWWGLQVGNNAISLSSDSGSDNISALLEWRNGVTGI